MRACLLGLVASIGAALAGCTTAPSKPKWVFYPPPPADPHVVHLQSGNRLSDFVEVPRHWLDVLRGAVTGPFVDTPAGLACAGGRLYICDPVLSTMHVWNLEDGSGWNLGERGTRLAEPVGVAVDSSGRVYVADTGRSEVVAFDAGGAVLRTFKPIDRGVFRPVAVAVYGQKLYVADAKAHCVDVFNTGDGRLISTLGGVGKAPGQFHFPMGLAVDTAGSFYVSDMLNSRVQVFDPAGKLVRTVGQPGDRYGDLGKPKQLAIAGDGVLFIADVDFAHVHLFDGQGRLLMLLGGPNATPLPSGVAVVDAPPAAWAAWLPETFVADYYVIVANSTGSARLSLYAVGRQP